MAKDNIQRTPAELALLASEARTRAILDAAVDAIITIDEVGLVESMNPAVDRPSVIHPPRSLAKTSRCSCQNRIARSMTDTFRNIVRPGRKKLSASAEK